MTLARRLVESGPGVRWHLGALRSRLLYTRAFARFGDQSVIVAPRQLRGTESIHIGARCAIYPGVWLQSEAGGGPLTIGDDTYLGHDVHVHAADPVAIGSRCVLADGVFITATEHGRDERSASHASGPVTIGDDVFIGQRAVILGGVSIGDGATIGAHSVVTRAVEPGQVVAGVPARPLDSRAGEVS